MSITAASRRKKPGGCKKKGPSARFGSSPRLTDLPKSAYRISSTHSSNPRESPTARTMNATTKMMTEAMTACEILPDDTLKGFFQPSESCLLYTSDAADEEDSV